MAYYIDVADHTQLRADYQHRDYELPDPRLRADYQHIDYQLPDSRHDKDYQQTDPIFSIYGDYQVPDPVHHGGYLIPEPRFQSDYRCPEAELLADYQCHVPEPRYEIPEPRFAGSHNRLPEAAQSQEEPQSQAQLQGDHQSPCMKPVTSWADVQVESEQELNGQIDTINGRAHLQDISPSSFWRESAQGEGSSQEMRRHDSDRESSESRSNVYPGKVPSRPNSGRKLCNKSISKDDVSVCQATGRPLLQHLGDETPP